MTLSNDTKLTMEQDANKGPEIFEIFGVDVGNLIILATIVLFTALGIILNVLALVSNFRKRRKMMFTFLIGLGGIDLINCLGLGVVAAKRLGVLDFIPDNIWCTVYPYWTLVGTLTSAFYVVLVAFVRYMRVQIHTTSMSYCWSVSLLISTLVCCGLICTPVLVSKNYVVMDTCYKFNTDEKDLVTYVNSFSGTIFACLFIGFLLLIVTYIKVTKNASVRLEINSSPMTRNRRMSTVTMANRKSVTYSDWLQNSEKPSPKKMSEAFLTEYQFPNARMSLDTACCQVPVVQNDKSASIDSDSDSARGSSFSSQSSSIFTPIKQYISPVDRTRRVSTWSEQGYRVGTPCYTTCMIIFAVMNFIFYFPYICMNIVYASYPEFRNHESFGVRVGLGLLEHSYMILFVLNPVVYRLSNRDFQRDLKKACCCCCSSYNWKRKNSFQARRSSVQVEGRVTQIRVPVNLYMNQEY